MAGRLKGRIAASTGKSEAEMRAMFIARQPMGRLGTAQEVAMLAVYLASDFALPGEAKKLVANRPDVVFHLVPKLLSMKSCARMSRMNSAA